MFKRFLSAARAALLVGMVTASSLSLAAVDVNQASAADLDSIKGIGPGTSAKIAEARKAGPFKDWADLIERVNGIGPASAAKLSGNGLTVNGQPYKADAAGASTPKTAVKPAAPPVASAKAASEPPAKKP